MNNSIQKNLAKSRAAAALMALVAGGFAFAAAGESGSIDFHGQGVNIEFTNAEVSYPDGANGDVVLKFTDPETPGTVQFPGYATAWVLSIGGGGAGGTGKKSDTTLGVGGGGGAGGFVERKGERFTEGIYTIQVGAGGPAGTDKVVGAGKNGAPSYIYRGADEDKDEIQKFTAYGGGGGGGESAGNGGASGGGGSMADSMARSGGTAIHGTQGSAGGVGSANKAAGGGGGAGGKGANATASNKSGAGGDGLPSMITLSASADESAAVYYAGGGGGGVTSGTGYGYGGLGNDKADGSTRSGRGGGALSGGTAPNAGADGFGGGGGGGTQAKAGAKGGNGIVIIRISEAMNGGPRKPVSPGAVIYTGKAVYGAKPSLAYELTGIYCATNVGSYQCTATLKDGFEWVEGGTDPVTVDWSIVEKQVSYPVGAEFTYDGEMKFAFTSLPEGVEYVSGKTNETEATDTDYVYTVKLANDNYVWKDAGEGKEHAPYDVHWFLHPKAIEKPVQAKLIYNGKEQFVLSTVDPAIEFVWTGDENNRTNAVNADTYYYIIRPKNSNYVWEGAAEGEERKELTESWDINPMLVQPPPCTSNLVYNGTEQHPVDVEAVEASEAYGFLDPSDWEESDAGSYLYTLRLKNTGEFQNYIWNVEPTPTYADQKFPWVIHQDTNYVSKLVLDGWKVGSTPYKPEYEVKWGKDLAIVRYAEKENATLSEWVEEPPTEEGTWWVWVHVDETNNWMKADAKKQFALWNDPDEIFSDHVVITVNNGANRDFTDYPLTITLNDNVPPGFTYERAGMTGKDLVFISADGMKQFPYEIVNWDPMGNSTVTVYLDILPKAGTTVSLYWALRDGKTTPAQPTKPEKPSTPSTYVTSTYGTVERDGKKVDSWSPAPTMTPTQWDEGSAPTITLNKYAVTSGAEVFAGYYDVYNPTVTNVFDAAVIADLPAGSYLAVFTAQKDENWLPIDYEIQFRVVGHSPTIGIAGNKGDSGRVLLMNSNAADASIGLAEISGQAYFTRAVNEYDPVTTKRDGAPNSRVSFWEFSGEDVWDDGYGHMLPYEDKTYNRQWGTNCVLWAKGRSRRLWHLTNCRHGNTYNKGDTEKYNGTPTMNANQNYLPWGKTSRDIDVSSSLGGAVACKVGQILMQNTTNACIYSPCYTNGVGTIYFDAVNGWKTGLFDYPDSYQIVVEVATETKDGSPLTEESSHVTTNAVGQAFTNDYSNIKEWKPVLMYPVHYKDGTLTPTNATTQFSLAVKTGATKSDFYRFYVPINHIPTPENPGGLRFRIRRVNYNPSLDIDDYAVLLVDNVLVSYPPMTATLHDLGWFDPEKKNEQTLGWENVTTVPFPSQYEKEAYGRARSTYYVNDGDPTAKTERFIVSAKMWYRWRYLTQLGFTDSAPFDSVDLNPGRLDYRSMQPLKFPGGVGDVEYWFETRFQAPYYEFQDYSGLNLGGAALKAATGYTEEITCTTNRYRATEKQSSAGKDWFFRLREGKSAYEGMRIYGHGSKSKEDVAVPMELVGDGSWRGYLRTPEPIDGGFYFRIEGLNPQGANDGTFSWSTNRWRAIVDNRQEASSYAIKTLPKTVNTETCDATVWSSVPCDAKTGYILFQFEEGKKTLTVARADYQDFNRWSTAAGTGGKFVGSRVEPSYSAADVGESNIVWSAWSLTPETKEEWKEDFSVASGQRASEVYPKDVPFASSNSVHGWLAENAMWVHSKWTHESWEDGEPSTKGDDSAVQLEGRGKGRLTFANASSVPDGLKNVISTMRLAQFNTFFDFNYWDDEIIDWNARKITYAMDMTNYTFVAFANLSEKGGSDYAGDGSVSLLGYFDDEVGCYEARFSRGSRDDNVRIHLYRWRNNGAEFACTDLGYRELEKDAVVGNFLSSSKSKSGALFLSVETVKANTFKNQPNPCTLVQAGFLRESVSYYSTAHESVFSADKKFLTLAFRDDSAARLTKGTYGCLSANCQATIMKMASFSRGLGTRNLSTANLSAANAMCLDKERKVSLSGGAYDYPYSPASRYHTLDDYYRHWKKRPGRLAEIRGRDLNGTVGFESITPAPIKVAVQVASHGSNAWRPVATNLVATYIDTTFENVVHSPLKCDVRFLVLGDPNDVRTDVVINGAELAQWCGQDVDGLGNTSEYGRYRDFIYTGGWIEKKNPSAGDSPANRVLTLQPARAADVNHPISLRSPALEGVGLLHFEWSDVDPAVKIKVQLTERETFRNLRDVLYSSTFEPSDAEEWVTLTNLDYKALQDLEKKNGTKAATIFVNHRAPTSGALRLVIDKAVVQEALRRQDSIENPMYGGIRITDAYVWDLPPYNPRCWSGWNMLCTGWESEIPDRFANLFDSPKGYSGILNNTLDKNTLRDRNSEYYKLNPPCIQSPTFGTNCIGEVLFKARLYDVPRGGKAPAVISFYGATKVDEESGEPVSNAWHKIEGGDVVIEATTFKTFSLKFGATQSYYAVRFAVTGVDGVVGGEDPVYDPPSRVVLDSLCVLEQAQPTVRFRNFHVMPFRDSALLKVTTAVPADVISSPDQQPLLDEAFGFQAELELEENEEGDIKTDDPKHPLRVELWYYQSAEPWGYDNWKNLPEAHHVYLEPASDSNLIFRTTMSRPESLAKPIFKKDVGNYGITQYHLVAHFYDRSGQAMSPHPLNAGEWSMPEWYRGFDDPNAKPNANFSAFTVLETVSPGRAWINEINYVEPTEEKSAARQFLEIAAPLGIDLSGWEVYAYSLDSAEWEKYEGDGPLFRLGDVNCRTSRKLTGDDRSHYGFITVRGPQASEDLVATDNVWNELNGDTIVNGTLAYFQPYGFELKRPSGIIAHRVVAEGDSSQYERYWFGYLYSGTNLVKELTSRFGERWVFAGSDPVGDAGDGMGLSVIKDHGEDEDDWAVRPLRPNALNEGQTIDPNWATFPNGDYVWIYLSCLDPHIRQIFGDVVNQGDVITVTSGGGTNFTYEVDNFYEMNEDAGDLKFESEHAFHEVTGPYRKNGKNYYDIAIWDVSNQVSVTANSSVSRQLQELGVTADNPYAPAIMNWLNGGVTRDANGTPVPFASDTIHPFIYRYPDNDTTNLSATVAYWLDVDITEPGWELRGAMGDTSGCSVPLNPLEPTLRGPNGEIVRTKTYLNGTVLTHTNRYCTLWMELTNTARTASSTSPIPAAHPPWRLQGLGNERSDAPSTFAMGGWTSVTFKVCGKLLNGKADDLARPMRYLVFDSNSFLPADDPDAPFSAWVEYVDPFSAQSPAVDWGWSKWFGTPVGFSWGLDDDLTPLGVSTMRAVDDLSAEYDPKATGD